MSRKVYKLIAICLNLVFTIILNLILHELGHALFAFLTGNKVHEISLGICSYANIEITNSWSIPLISLGSFILPLVLILLVLAFYKNRIYPNLLFMPLGVITGICLITSGIAAFIPNTAIELWDILLFANYAGINQKVVGVISLLIGTSIMIICFIRYLNVICKWVL